MAPTALAPGIQPSRRTNLTKAILIVVGLLFGVPFLLVVVAAFVFVLVSDVGAHDSTGPHYVEQNESITLPPGNYFTYRFELKARLDVGYSLNLPIGQFVQECLFPDSELSQFEKGESVNGYSCSEATNMKTNQVGPLSPGHYVLGFRNLGATTVTVTYSIWLDEAGASGQNAVQPTLGLAQPSNVRRVFIEPVPAYAADPTGTRSAVASAVHAWSARGWQITESSSAADANVVVQFVKEWGGDRLGQTYSSSFIQVGLGDSTCNQVWTPFDTTSLHHIAAHEFGHALGLEHSTDANEVMYPDFQPHYAQPCEITQGDISIPAGARAWIGFTPTPAGRVDYTVSELGDGGVDVGLIKFADRQTYLDGGSVYGWAWRYNMRQVGDGASLGADQYAMALECKNAYDKCVVHYAITIQF